jgi:nucleoside-diphosphate-sugar epimerase
MKISMTGHTSGIGKALAARLVDLGHQVIGFSLETGHDIGSPLIQKMILPIIKKSDMFINNAYHETGQTKLLTEILDAYKGTAKTLIHMGSFCAIQQEHVFFEIFPDNLYTRHYIKEKKLQLNIINNHLEINRQRVLHVMPGLVKTKMLGPLLKTMSTMDPDDVAELICNIIFSQKDKVYVQQLIITSL